MSTAAVGAGDTSATFAFETREAGALTSRAITNSLVTALTVEVCLIPFGCVVSTRETVRGVVLFTHETIVVLVLDLLICVEASI
jgi:hypothetical protein